MSLITQLFQQLLTPKNVVTEMSGRSSLTAPFGTQRVNGYKTLPKSA